MEETSPLSNQTSPGAAEKAFHYFDDIEATDVDFLELPSPERDKESAWRVVVHVLDVIVGQLDLVTPWRFVAVALPMAVNWKTGSVSILNFLVPYFLCLFLLAWPLLLFEMGLAQTTGGESMKAFGSLSKKSRAGGLGWVFSGFFTIFSGAIAVYSLLFLVVSFKGVANYTSPGIQAAEASDLYVGRECTYYRDYVPHMSPLICGPQGKRLDISCHDESQCHLWAGSGRCLAVPWAPASEFLFTSSATYDPLLDQDYPQYCAARALHDITTSRAKAVVNAKGYWKDFKGHLSWRLPFAFFCVFAYALLPAVNSTVTPYVRIARGSLGLVMLTIVALASWIWFTKESAESTYRKNWTGAWQRWDWSMVGQADLWAFAFVQAALTLKVGTGRNEWICSKAPRGGGAANVAALGIGVVCANVAMSLLALVAVWNAYGLTATKLKGEGLGPADVFSTVRFDVRNSGYGVFWTSIETMFDNDSRLAGNSRSGVWNLFFWAAMTELGTNGVHQQLMVVTGAFAYAQLNWKTSFSFLACACFFAGLMFLASIPQWIGTSWAYTITFHHFLTNWAYPAFLLYESFALAWLVAYHLTKRHFGRAFAIQLFLWLLAAALAAFFFAATWRSAPRFLSLTIFASFAILIALLSFLLPFFFLHSHDAHSRKNPTTQKLSLILTGPLTHVRRQINYRTCHAHTVLCLHPGLTTCVRYGLSTFAMLAFANNCVSYANLWKFSPYLPYNISYRDQFTIVEVMLGRMDLLRAPAALVGVAAWIALTLIIAPPVCMLLPNALELFLPPNTDENFFQVNEAIETFASNLQKLEQVPYLDARQHAYVGQTQSHYFYNASGQPNLSQSIVPSQAITLDPVVRDQVQAASDALRLIQDTSESSESSS